MKPLENKIYTFSVQNEDGSERIEVVRTSNWEGLQPWEQLNMFKVLLLQESWGERTVQCIRILEESEMEDLYPEQPSILEEYQEE